MFDSYAIGDNVSVYYAKPGESYKMYQGEVVDKRKTAKGHNVLTVRSTVELQPGDYVDKFNTFREDRTGYITSNLV